MEAQEALIRDLPDSAERIRRRFWRDAEFRTVCADYRDALEAAATFGALDLPEDGRAEQYRRLTAELLAEAIEMLEGKRT